LEHRHAACRSRRGVDIEAIEGTTLRRGAGAVAAVGAAFLGGLPLLVARGLPPLQLTFALAASIALVAALVFAPSLLPPAIALYGAEIVVSVHRGRLSIWTIPLVAVALLVVYEAGELRHRLPSGSLVERGAVRALTWRIALTAGLGLLGSAAVVAASNLSGRGGPVAAVVGGLAVAAAVYLVRVLGGRVGD